MDDKLPVTEYKSGKERKTWVTVLRERRADSVRFTRPMFGGSSEGSIWECKLKKPDGPRQRKRYLGYSTTWSSVIVVNCMNLQRKIRISTDMGLLLSCE